ncbi:unnamed protein product [Phytomonas sp. Hart1]|nr:unnamed protein product [Phytomonas sp. Hart1]|eukprot:CCW66687.1 unnamed protein product [Phytomonas sp. isolate Hart1]
MTLGDSGVGKSCLIKRYCEGRFIPKYIPTIGIDYGVKLVTVNPVKLEEERAKGPKGAAEGSNSSAAWTARAPTAVRVNFWDVAGGAESLEIRNEFYAPTQGILLIYNVGDLKSFESLDRWVEEMNRFISIPLDSGGAERRTSVEGMMATGNTPAGREVGAVSDQSPVVFLCGNKADGGTQRAVTEEQGRRWAAAHGGMEFFETSASSDLNVATMMERLFHRVIARFMSPK